MATPRTRKPAPQTEDKSAVAPGTPDADTENKAVVGTENKTAAEEGPQPPDVAPLEPPAPPKEPEVTPIPGPQEVLPAELSDVILDDATGKPPTDPDGVFTPVPEAPYGNVQRCTVRLVERVGMGTYRTPTTRLLVPVGAELSRLEADRIVARLRAQTAQTGE